MSYRPKVKNDNQGTITDLPLDAETVKGVDVVAQLQNKSNVGHTHSSNDITQGYLNVHPENGPTLIPFMNNDIAFLLKRGGSAIVKKNDAVITKDISNCFDGSPTYCGFESELSGATSFTIELTLHKTFAWGNTIYVDFGNSGWRAKSIKLEVMNSNYPDDVWTQKGSTTTNASGHYSVSVQHTPVGGSSAGNGFNKIRYTFSTWNNASIFRIAQIGIYNYGSGSLRETSMSRGIDDYIFRNITPNANNTYKLGDSTHKWSEIHGALKGTADNASKLNNQEASYYLNYNNLTNKPTIPSAVTEATVSGWGFTKNAGTVTSVSAGTGLSISGTASTTPTVNVASNYKLLTTTEYNALNAKVSNVQSDWNATTGLARILNKPDILPITNYTGDSPVELYNLSKGRYINATANDIALRNYAGGVVLPSVRWHPGEILTVMDDLHSWVLGTEYTAGEYYIFSGKANSTFALSEYRGSSVADIANIPSSIGLGSESKPLYIEVATNEQGMKQNTFKECKPYGGGTGIVKLNGYDALGKSYSAIFAPETAGTSGQILKSNGGGAPVWEDDVYVKYSEAQSLTNAQKTQARSNIGAGTSSLAIGTTASTAAAGNHTHSTTLATDSGTATVTMVPDTTYKLSTGGTNVIFKTPSDAYKIVETLRKGSEADSAVGYYKIATINHVSWNFCDFCMLVKNSYAGVAYSTIFNCSCSDSNVDLRDFKLNIISGTDISNKLAYLYTYDSNNNLIKVEVFIHATRFEHPMCYILNARSGQQLVIPTQDEFNKATPDQPDGTTMTGYATYIYNSMYLAKGGDTLDTGGLTLGSGNGNGLLFPSGAVTGTVNASIGVNDPNNNNQYCTLNGFISGTFTVGHGNFPLNLRGSATRPQYKGADLALKSDVPKRVTGSWSVSTSNPGPMVDIILAHPNIKIYYRVYTSGTKKTDIMNVIFYASYGETQNIYTLTLRYINASGSLTNIGSGTIYYEYFE